MGRCYVVTGASSGMGKAVADLLEGRGGRVIRCDLNDGDVRADLASPAARRAMIEEIGQLSGGVIDGLLLCAGIAAFVPAAVSINYFGMVELLDGLRPLLKRSDAPRAAAISSLGSTFETDEAIIAACLGHDEAAALAAAEARAGDPVVYTSTKRAVQLACRHRAVQPEWAGAGILLNLVAPGIVDTPMMAERLRNPQILAALQATMPLATGRYGTPEEIAELLAFLVSPANGLIVGQQLIADCGSDAIRRPDHV